MKKYFSACSKINKLLLLNFWWNVQWYVGDKTRVVSPNVTVGYLSAVWRVMWCRMFFVCRMPECVFGSVLSSCSSLPLFSYCLQEAAFRTDRWLSWQDLLSLQFLQGDNGRSLMGCRRTVCVWCGGFIRGVGDFLLGNCRFIPAERPSCLCVHLMWALKSSWG